MKQLKYSRQRESIKEFLLSTKSHPTADVIYQNVKEEYPKISLGTVYRNLTLLVETGEVKKISTGDGMEHYDGDVSPHSHYYCRCCHKIVDVDITASAEQILAASSIGVGTIESANMMFTGVCMECSDTNRIENNI